MPKKIIDNDVPADALAIREAEELCRYSCSVVWEPSMFKFKTLFIMRGLPGSGKSSIAESLVGGGCQHTTVKDFRFLFGREGVICTTDAYFYDDWSPDGSYLFDPTKIALNHQLNQAAV